MVEAFQVASPGILTTFQDLGRTGYRRYGIPQSGAMDTLSLRAANLLVGNSESKVGLEITLQGLRMIAMTELFIAVTGADLSFTINGIYCPPWQSFLLKEGDEIHFRTRRSGFRAYLAVRGGFRAPTFLESGSVFQRGSMGVPLKKGQVLESATVGTGYFARKRIPARYLPKTSGRMEIGVVLGPQMEAFTVESVKIFVFVYRLNGRMKSGICRKVVDKCRDFGYRRLDECA